jgi:hypothetical protein
MNTMSSSWWNEVTFSAVRGVTLGRRARVRKDVMLVYTLV